MASEADVVVMTAAVADFRPARTPAPRSRRSGRGARADRARREPGHPGRAGPRAPAPRAGRGRFRGRDRRRER
ncbi:hypothetical protein NKG05_27850 [Oerskovia sp. M15]